MNRVDKWLQQAEISIGLAERWKADGEAGSYPWDQRQAFYSAAIYLELRALYEQNRALVELLREAGAPRRASRARSANHGPFEPTDA